MKYMLILLLMIVPPAHADEVFSTSPPDAEAAANAYARAAGLAPLKKSGGFELRIWGQDHMLGSVMGTVVSNGTKRSFETSSSYKDEEVTVRTAHLSKPKPVANLIKLKGLVAELEPYDKAFISCGVMDGGSVLIDAVVQDQRITFEVDNPQFCKDKASHTVVKLLNLLGT